MVQDSATGLTCSLGAYRRPPRQSRTKSLLLYRPDFVSSRSGKPIHQEVDHRGDIRGEQSTPGSGDATAMVGSGNREEYTLLVGAVQLGCTPRSGITPGG